MRITLRKKLTTLSLISVLVTLPISAEKFDTELHNKILPMSAEDSLNTMILQDGYSMEIVAAEPLIEEPVTMAFDGNGRIYVAEMLTYMQDADGSGTFKSISRIKRLEDKDGDGLFESYTIFADKLLLPRMISTLDDGRILVRQTNTTDLILLTDSDGDGVADKRETVYQGGKKGGNLEHQPSGLIYSLDNWMYVARSKQRYKYVDGKVQAQKIHAAGGQWGLAQDKAGRHYFSAAGAQNPVFGFQAPVVYGSINVAGEQAEGYREVFPIDTTPDVQGGEKMLRKDNTLNHFTGGGGQSIYVGGLFDDMEGDYIIAEPVGNMIRRSKVVRSEGHTVISNPYQAQRKEFVVSSDANFRPVWTDTAPDGSLMILDMYRGIIQESEWTKKGSYLRGGIDNYGFDKVIGRGRLYRIFKEGVPLYSLPKMFNETPAQLVKHLSHKNRWWRLEAQKLIVLSGDQSVVPALKNIVLESRNSDARIHALWTLEGLGIIDKALLIKLFNDTDNKLKVQAIRVSEQLAADSDIAAHWAKLAHSKDIEVAQQSLLSAFYLKTQNRELILSTVKGNYAKSKGFKAIEYSINEVAAKKARLKQLASGNQKFAKAMIAGEEAFNSNCASCHGANGKGAAMGKDLIAPSFHKNPRVTGNTPLLTNLVTKGLTGEIDGKSYAGMMMPSIASNGDEYVANVLTYIRNKFGNLASMITAEEVASIKKLAPPREAMWTQKELVLAFNQDIGNKDQWKVTANFAASSGEPLKHLHDGKKARFASAVNRMDSDAITVELPEAVILTEIHVDFFKWEKPFYNSARYQTSISMDGEDWLVLDRDENLKDYRTTQALGHKAKFIKITNKENGREWKIIEINLFGRKSN